MDDLTAKYAADWLATRLVCAFVEPGGRVAFLRYAQPTPAPDRWIIREAETRLGVLPPASLGHYVGDADDLGSVSKHTGGHRYKWTRVDASALAAYQLAVRQRDDNPVLLPRAFGLIGAHYYHDGQWIDTKTAAQARQDAYKLIHGYEDDVLLRKICQEHEIARQAKAWNGATEHWAGRNTAQKVAGIVMDLMAHESMGHSSGIMQPSIIHPSGIGYASFPQTVAAPVSKVCKLTSDSDEFRVVDGVLHLVNEVRFSVVAPPEHPVWKMLPKGLGSARVEMDLRKLLPTVDAGKYRVWRCDEGPEYAGFQLDPGVLSVLNRRYGAVVGSPSMPSQVVEVEIDYRDPLPGKFLEWLRTVPATAAAAVVHGAIFGLGNQYTVSSWGVNETSKRLTVQLVTHHPAAKPAAVKPKPKAPDPVVVPSTLKIQPARSRRLIDLEGEE